MRTSPYNLWFCYSLLRIADTGLIKWMLRATEVPGSLSNWKSIRVAYFNKKSWSY